MTLLAPFRLIQEPREGARLRRAVDHRPEFVEPHLAPAWQRDRQRRKIGDAARACERADRLLLARDLAAAAAEIDVVGADLLVDRRGGDAEHRSFSRSSRTRISRSTPPKRLTSPTPRML